MFRNEGFRRTHMEVTISQLCKGCTNIVWGCRVCKCECDPCKKEDYIPPGQAPPTNLEETRQEVAKAAKEAAAETKEEE